MKRIFAGFIVAVAMLSAVPAMAEETAYMSREAFIEHEMFDNSSDTAVLLSEPDEFSAKVTSEIEKQQVDGEKCTVVIDGLEQFNLDCEIVGNDTPEDAQYVLDMYMDWGYMYNITSVKGECNNDYILEKLTFEIDNTISIDTVVEAMADKAAEKFEKPDNYEKTSDELTQFPIALVRNNSSEIISKLQIKHPELCYVENSVKMRIGASYSQLGKEFDIETQPKIILSYLPISFDEYKAFEKKLDDIVKEVIYPDMNDTQKAMALHDWIIDNVRYGYRLDATIYEGRPTAKYHIISNIEEYEKLMNMLGSEEMIESRKYAHTSYAPAMSGYGVCQGYTMLYAALLNKVGIENGTFISDAMKHQWSLVKIDGQWYHTDVTWDDPTPSRGYETITLQTSTGDKLKLRYQTEQYHHYNNFLVSEERCVEEGHTTDEDPNSVMFPEVECDDDKFHTSEVIGNEEYWQYAFAKVNDTKLNYSVADKMYYYAQDVRVNGEETVWYYKLPFVLKNENGTFAEAEQVSEEVFNAAIEGKNPDIGDDDDQVKPDEPKDPDEPDNPDEPPENEYVAVQMPNEAVIDNSVVVECKVSGEEGDGLTMENIGTSIVTITAKEGAEEELKEVDAYLVYYGENNIIIDMVMKTVAIDYISEIQFDGELPEGAVEAKIIILNSDSELVPIIKALGVTAELPEEPAA